MYVGSQRKASNKKRMVALQQQAESTATDGRWRASRARDHREKQVVEWQEEAAERAHRAELRRQEVGLQRVRWVTAQVLGNDMAMCCIVWWRNHVRQHRKTAELVRMLSRCRDRMVASWAIQSWEVSYRARQTWLAEMEARQEAERQRRAEQQPIGLGDRLFRCTPQLARFGNLPPVSSQSGRLDCDKSSGESEEATNRSNDGSQEVGLLEKLTSAATSIGFT